MGSSTADWSSPVWGLSEEGYLLQVAVLKLPAWHNLRPPGKSLHERLSRSGGLWTLQGNALIKWQEEAPLDPGLCKHEERNCSSVHAPPSLCSWLLMWLATATTLTSMTNPSPSCLSAGILSQEQSQASEWPSRGLWFLNYVKSLHFQPELGPRNWGCNSCPFVSLCPASVSGVPHMELPPRLALPGFSALR